MLPSDTASLLTLAVATMLAALFALILLRLKIGSPPRTARLLRHR
jgi:hypothetical protein